MKGENRSRPGRGQHRVMAGVSLVADWDGPSWKKLTSVKGRVENLDEEMTICKEVISIFSSRELCKKPEGDAK